MAVPDYMAHVGDETLAGCMQDAYTKLICGDVKKGTDLLMGAVELGKKNNVSKKPCEIMAMVYHDAVLGLEDTLRSSLGFLSGTTEHLPRKENLEKYPEIARISGLIGVYLLAFYETCGNSIRCGDSDD